MKKCVACIVFIPIILVMLGGSAPVFAQETDKARLIEQLNALNKKLATVSDMLISLKEQQAALMEKAGFTNQDAGAIEQEHTETPLQQPRKIGAVAFGKRDQSQNKIAIRLETDFLAFEHENGALDFAIDDPNSVGNPNGDLFKVDPDEVHGGRYSVWINLPALPFEIGYRETNFDGYWDGSAADLGPGQIWHTRMHTDSAIDSAISSAHAMYDLDYKVSDIEISKSFDWSNTLDATFFGGARFANIDTKFLIDYVDGGSNERFTEINEVNGIGPYVGLKSGWKLPFGFRLEGTFNVSLLNCDIDFNTSDDVSSIRTEFDDELVPVIGYSAGIGWQATAFDSWHLKLGVEYEAQHWFDMYHQYRSVDDVDEGKITPVKGNMNFQGLVYTIGVEKSF